MAGYKPLRIVGNSTGLVEGREEFILPDDAYPSLINAYVWRERIKRKQAFELLGRLQRNVEIDPPLNTNNLITGLGLETDASIVIGSVTIIGAMGQIYTEPNPPDGTLVGNAGGSGTINYSTGAYTITGSLPITGTFNYYPNLPVMGLRTRELTATNNEQMVAFDTTYAYIFSGTAFQEFLPGTVWTGSDSDFFWSTNYWVGDSNLKIFWVMNDVDPIRYTNGVPGTNWVPFTPQINAAGGQLLNALVMLPFRGRLVVFNTTETDGSHPNRIRWAAIGNPFTKTDPVNIPPINIVIPGAPAFQENAWRDDVRGKGGFLDIPTSENIITVGFVRDNLVIYCERSTWQLRYTGRTIAPFQIEKVNTELGVEGTFSGVQFDTSLVGIGDKGVVECDSFKSERIDIKIPDLVMEQINNNNEGPKRVHGIRNFQTRLAFWIYPNTASNGIYPDRRLVYNYENDSWAIFTDSLTALGTFQKITSRKWSDQPTLSWNQANFPWIDRPALFPSIMGGNQQGFVLYLDEQTTNQESLYIKNITGNTTTPTSINSPNHNLQTADIIMITSIPTGTPFASSLNGGIFSVNRTGPDDFYLLKYDAASGQFITDQLDPPGTYIGGGLIRVRDNFSILSKKFNYMEEGKQYQLGYIDVLFDATAQGAISMFVYNNYDVDYTTNTPPDNAENDTFFNSVVETNSVTGIDGGDKNWKRIFCPTNSNFVTIQWTLSNAQMNGVEQESDVQIDAQVIWSRVGGRLGITI